MGVALSDPLGIAAGGLPTLARRDDEALAADVAALVAEHEVRTVVVGLPLNMDGSRGERARRTEAFAARLRSALPASVGVETWDERLSTVEAQRALGGAGLSRRRRAARVDRVAAQLILRSWLESRRA